MNHECEIPALNLEADTQFVKIMAPDHQIAVIYTSSFISFLLSAYTAQALVQKCLNWC